MNRVIPSPLAILFIAAFAWGVGFFLTKFAEKITIEAEQSQSALSVKLEIPKQELKNFKK